MIHLWTIWSCIKKRMPRGKWVDIGDIYDLIEKNNSLDEEDFEWQSPSSSIPKWMRNVRNVLQYRKSKGEIEWNGQRGYKL